MRSFGLITFSGLAFLSALGAASAQTQLVKPKVDPDPCSKTNPTERDAILTCGREAAYHRFYPVALKWYLKAAELGSLEAAYRVSQIYYDRDEGVPQDLILAYMWMDITAAQDGKCLGDNESEIGERDVIARDMTRPQLARAEGLSRQWLSTHTQDCTRDPENPILPEYR